MSLKGNSNEEKIWNYFKSNGLNDYGVSGLMGNLFCESGLMPNNLQNTGNKKLGMTDDEYVTAVDNGTYSKFVKDSQGFGICQWTFWTRKQNLLNYAKSQNKSIGDLEMQLDFLYKELNESYKSVLNTLKNATSVLQASNAVLLNFERPADQSKSAQNRRASYGQVYYNKYAKNKEVKPDSSVVSASASSSVSKTKTEYANSFSRSLKGTYKTIANLNMRSGAGTSKKILTTIPKGGKVVCYGYYTIVNGVKWYYVAYKSYVGFISSKYLNK